MAVLTLRNDIELGSVTNWPAVYAAAGVGAFLAVGLVAVGVLALTQVRPAPKAAAEVASLRPAPPPHAPDATFRAAPTPAAKPSEEPPLCKPLVPAPTLVTSPTVKPIVVRPDLISVAIPVPLPAPAPAVQEREALLSNELQSNMRQIDLDAANGTALRLLANADQRDRRSLSLARSEALKMAPSLAHGETIVSLVGLRADLAGLPVRDEPDCRASKETAKCLEDISPFVR